MDFVRTGGSCNNRAVNHSSNNLALFEPPPRAAVPAFESIQMTRQLTPENDSSRYVMREAREHDLEAMVTLFNGFAKCKLYRTLYPGLQDASQLSEVNRKQLVNWIQSPQRQLNVFVHQKSLEVVAFCQWALDDSSDLPYSEKYCQGSGTNHDALKSFTDAIGDYDDRLCGFDDFICKWSRQNTGSLTTNSSCDFTDIDWLVIAEAHQNQGLLTILLSWGWRYAVQHKRYILLDPIEGESLPLISLKSLRALQLIRKYTGCRDHWDVEKARMRRLDWQSSATPLEYPVRERHERERAIP